jgi:rod shape-determining protein MreD
MGDPVALRLWAGRGLYLLIACLVVFVRLLPLDSSPSRFPAPDLLVAVTFAWVLRRPEQVPPLLIAAVFLVCDLLFLRPPGLWTLLMLLGSEFLRARQNPAVDLPFAVEWFLVAVVLLVAILAESLTLGLFVVPRTPIGVALLHGLLTLAVYPAVVAVLRLGLGVRRAAPGETDALGRRP